MGRTTRAWVQKSLTKHLPMAAGEEMLAAMAASYWQNDFYRAWRPGRAYLTTHRLIIHRRDPSETLWQTELSAITDVQLVQESSVGGEDRTRLRIQLDDKTEATISAADPPGLLKLIRVHLPHVMGSAEAVPPPQDSDPVFSGPAWYLESFAQGSTWRGGHATLEKAGDFTWKSPMDSRALIRCTPDAVVAVGLEERANPTDHRQVLRVETGRTVYHLASADLKAWRRYLTDWSQTPEEASRGTAS